nr:retrotransposon protein, putative, Ty1-copia subclass [Tanacetum cinerariifolium]
MTFESMNVSLGLLSLACPLNYGSPNHSLTSRGIGETKTIPTDTENDDEILLDDDNSEDKNEDSDDNNNDETQNGEDRDDKVVTHDLFSESSSVGINSNNTLPDENTKLERVSGFLASGKHAGDHIKDGSTCVTGRVNHKNKNKPLCVSNSDYSESKNNEMESESNEVTNTIVVGVLEKIIRSRGSKGYVSKIRTRLSTVLQLQGFKEEMKLSYGEQYLQVGNGAQAAVEAIGVFDLVLPFGLVLKLNNCYYAHSIVRGIVSLSCLLDLGFNHTIASNGNSVSLNGLFYFSDVSVNGVFEIDMNNNFSKNNNNSIFSINKKRKLDLDSSYLWHGRLAHIGKTRMQKLQREGLLESINDESFDKCESCISEKMTKKTFNDNIERATDLFGLIHTDVCGPLRHLSRKGASYFLTFTDDFSRYGYVYLLKHKHDVFENFKVFKSEVELQLGKKIKALRSDRGGSSGLRRFFRYAMFIYSFYLCYSLSLYPFTERYAQPYFFSCLIRQVCFGKGGRVIVGVVGSGRMEQEVGRWKIQGLTSKIMSSITAQQTKLDLELVPKENRHDIGEINSLNDVVVDQMHQPWRTFAALINRGLSGKTSAFDKLRLSRAQILWGMYYQKNIYRAILRECLTSPAMKESKAYKTYLSYATGVVPPKIARKFKKSSPSKKDSDLVPVDEEPIKEVRKKSLRDFHKLHPSGSGTAAQKPPKVYKITLPVTSEGSGDKPGVPDVTKDESTESESESWGNDKDDSNDENDSEKEGKDKENKSDDDETPSDNEKGSDSKQDSDGSESDSKSDQEEYDDDEVKDNDDDDKFEDIPPHDAEIGSLLDVHVHHEVQKIHTSTLLTVPVSVIPEASPASLVDDHLDTRMGPTREEFINFLSTSLIDRITEKVRNQMPQILPKEVSNFALPVIEMMITKLLNQVNLAKAFSQPQSTYEAAATFTEFELKKIMIDKMNSSTKSQPKSYVKSVHAEEPKFEVGNTNTPQGQEGNQEPTDPDWKEEKIPQKGPTQNWLMNLASYTSTNKSLKVFDELMSTPIDFSSYILNGLKIKNLTQEILLEPTFRLLKGTRSNYVELEYDFKECYKALSENLDWDNPKGGDYPLDLSKPLPLIMRGNRQSVPVEFFINDDLKYLQGGISTMIYMTSTTKTKAAQYDLPGIEDMVPTYGVLLRFFMINMRYGGFHTEEHNAVTHVSVMRKHRYRYLEEIVVRRVDNALYKFKEGDFPRLRINDIEDMLLLMVQNRLINLLGDDVADFAIALRIFTRSLVIQKRVKDLQLGVESYQK